MTNTPEETSFTTTNIQLENVNKPPWLRAELLQQAATDVTTASLLDGLLVILVLLAVEDLNATLLGSWTAGQTAGQRTHQTCLSLL